ncbi:hypothetical protein [Klebsiella phage 175004]|nr:hypothetical protein GHCGIGKI_01165 [Klebsiella phage P06]
MKCCSKCKVEKPRSEFGKDKCRPLPYNWCRSWSIV